MKTRRFNTQSMVAAAAIGSLLFLGGCGSSTPGSEGNASPEGASASASASPSPSSPSPTAAATGAASQTPSSSSAEATSSTEPSGGASETAAAAPPATAPAVTTAPAAEPAPTAAPAPTDPIANRCTANMLTGEIINAPGGGAAGSVYRHLVLINTGSKDCVLHGWAGVSYVADGAQVGAAAERDPQQVPFNNILAPGQAAAATLQETRAQNYTDCSPVDTTGIRVYPPEDTSSLIIAHQSTGCANASIKLLTIGTFEPFSLAQ